MTARGVNINKSIPITKKPRYVIVSWEVHVTDNNIANFITMADRDSNTSKTIGSTSNDVETVYDNVGMQSDPNTGQGLMSVSDSAVVIKGHATYETKIITIIYY